MPTPEFSKLFALDMQRVLNDEISDEFGSLQAVSLTSGNLAILAEHELEFPNATKGLYILHHRGAPVYVGKAEDSLRGRLDDHRIKLGSRKNMNVSEVAFRCLYLDKNWSALTHEKPLIERFGFDWNSSGFGNHDPGRNRDKTFTKPSHFDRRYPIDADYPLSVEGGTRTVETALQEIRNQAPFVVRHQVKKGSRSHPDYRSHSVTFVTGETVKTAIGKVVDSLGGEWQATFLYGRLILYREVFVYDSERAFLSKHGASNWIVPIQDGESDEDADVEAEN